MNRAIFIDRDGVITQEPPHYAHRLDQLKLIPGSAEAIKLLNENTFKEIWESQKWLSSIRWAATELETHLCRINCRMDAINRYLWELKNPSEHVNFI